MAETSEAPYAPMGIVWIVVFVVVAIAAGLTSWEIIEDLLANQGVSDEGAALIGWVAGYTLPLTLAAAIVTLGVIHKDEMNVTPIAAGLSIAAVLVGAGLLSAWLGLGKLPQYSYQQMSGPLGWLCPCGLSRDT